MLEVEVKAKVEDLGSLCAIFESQGVVFDVQKQKDTVFVRDVSSVESFYQNDVFIRIREVPGKDAVLTLKKKQRDLASLEYETAIGSVDEMGKILVTLGFVEAVVIDKERLNGEHQGYTLCLDEVEGLGSFVEVEKLVEEGDIKGIQEELWTWLLGLEASGLERVTDAYDTLLLRQRLSL